MKWSKTIAQGFSPGYDIPHSSALKALPTPRGGVQFGESNPRTASRGHETEVRSVL
jgi:hypothetical protein